MRPASVSSVVQLMVPPTLHSRPDRSRPVRVLPVLCGVALVLATGCRPESGPGQADADRTEWLGRIDALERRLEERDQIGEESAVLLRERLENFDRRVTAMEASLGGPEQGLAQRQEYLEGQLQHVHVAVNQLLDFAQTGQGWIRFGIGYSGHAVARTPHGSFLIELVSQDAAADGDGYQLQLRIGNTTSMTVHQFRLAGDFGAPPPQVSAERPDAVAYASWEASLQRFEASFAEPLPPAAWKEIVLRLPAKRLADLRHIRVRMDVERAGLPEAEDLGGGDRLVIGLESRGGFILRTDHGSIILVIEQVRKTEKGHEMDVKFGNPLGFTVTRCALTGRFGPAHPKVGDFADFEKYRFALSEWQQRLRTFEIEIPGELLPFAWNAKTLRFRTDNPAELAFIECRLEVRNISLRQP